MLQHLQPEFFTLGKHPGLSRGEETAFIGRGDFHPGDSLGADGQAVFAGDAGSAGGSPGAGQEEQSQGAADQKSCNQGPELGLSIVQHPLHSFLDPDFSEGQRGHPEAPVAHGAFQHGPGVGSPSVLIQSGYCSFIAGQFYVPAEQHISGPNERMKPIDTYHGKSQQLPPGVPPAQMGTFMGQNQGNLIFGKTRGQIDSGPEQSQDTGRRNIVAHPISGRWKGGPNLAFQKKVVSGAPQEGSAHACQPEPGENGNQSGAPSPRGVRG